MRISNKLGYSTNRQAHKETDIAAKYELTTNWSKYILIDLNVY